MDQAMKRSIKVEGELAISLARLGEDLKKAHCRLSLSDLGIALLELGVENISPQTIAKLQDRFFDERTMVRNLSKSPQAIDEKARQTLKALSARIQSQKRK